MPPVHCGRVSPEEPCEFCCLHARSLCDSLDSAWGIRALSRVPVLHSAEGIRRAEKVSAVIEAEPKASTRSLAAFIGVANLVIFGAFLLISLPFYWTQIRILESWPEADAQVIRAEVALVKTEVAPDGSRLYESRVQFLFTVNGKPEIAEDRSHRSPELKRVRYETNKFQVGSHRRILYNPKKYTDIRVNAGLNRRFFFVPLLISGFGAVFGVIGAICLFGARRRKRRHARA